MRAVIINFLERLVLLIREITDKFTSIFGEDIFASRNLPDYIVSGELETNEYLSANGGTFRDQYIRLEEMGSYVLFEKREKSKTGILDYENLFIRSPSLDKEGAGGG